MNTAIVSDLVLASGGDVYRYFAALTADDILFIKHYLYDSDDGFPDDDVVERTHPAVNTLINYLQCHILKLIPQHVYHRATIELLKYVLENPFIPHVHYHNYMISCLYPYELKRKSTNHIVSEYLEKNDKKGNYYRMNIYNDNGERHKYPKHVLIAEQFIHNDDPINKTVVDHRDTNSTNNHISNLRWCTQQTNSLNKKGYGKYTYTYINSLPDGTQQLLSYSHYQLNDYYINTQRKEVYLKVDEFRYRILRVASYKNRCFYCVTTAATTTNHKTHILIPYNKLFN